MDPLTLMALATFAQVGFGMFSQQEQAKAARQAQKDSAKRMVSNQNKIARESFRRRKERSTVLGGASASAAEASQQGTILTGTSNQARSLLG